MPSKTTPYREALLESLSDPTEAAHYLNAAIRDSPEMFLKALRNVAQSRQMARVARDAGVTRESLYRATSEIGNPTLETLSSVLGAMGIKLIFEATPISESGDTPQGQTLSSAQAATAQVSSGQILQTYYRPEKLVSPNPEVTKIDAAELLECTIADAQRREEYVTVN
jgi:probable addiction module antidote protein